MSKGVVNDPFGNPCLIFSHFYRFLQTGFKNMKTSGNITVRVPTPIHIQILFPQANTFHEPKAASVMRFGHGPVCSFHFCQDTLNFGLRRDRRWMDMSFCFHRFKLILNGLVEYMAVKKDYGIQGLLLSGCRYLILGGGMA